MKYILPIIFLFAIVVVKSYAGGGGGTGPVIPCSSAEIFCSNTALNFPNSDSSQAPSGLSYGCLFSQPNPTWYYLNIGTSGPMQLTISQTTGPNGTGTTIDVDFAMWGPFSSVASGCDSIMNGSGPIQSSFSGFATETAGIGMQGGYGTGSGCQTTPPAAQAGEYYILMITNFSGQPGYISLSQTGGTGSTNCGCALTVENSGPICPDNTATLTATNVIDTSQPALSYSWSGPNGFYSTDSIVQTPILSVPDTYSYTFTIYREHDTCVGTTSVVVLPRKTTTRDINICLGDNDSGHTTSGTYIDTFAATNGCDSIVTTHLTVLIPDTVTTSLKLCASDLPTTWNGINIPVGTKSKDSFTHYTTTSIKSGCDSTTYLNLDISTFKVGLISSADTIVEGQSVTLTTSANSAFNVISWSPGYYFTAPSLYVQTVKPTTTTLFTILGKDALGCEDTAMKNIIVLPFNDNLGIPTAFSPNGDGVNDVFKISIGNKQVKGVSLRVYDRYGRLVHQTGYDQQAKWDGTQNGKVCEVGTYFYTATIVYVNDRKETIKGDVTLIR